jgi:hypothetical protein
LVAANLKSLHTISGSNGPNDDPSASSITRTDAHQNDPMDEYHAQNDLNQHATVYTGANRVGFEEFEGIETNDDAGCPIGGYAFEGDARDMEVNPHAGHYGSAAESGDENDEDDSGNDEVEHDNDVP